MIESKRQYHSCTAHLKRAKSSLDGWGGWENLDGWMKWMGIDCTTTSSFSFEKRIWIIDGWMDGKDWVLRIAYSLPAVRGFAFLIPGYGMEG